LFLGEANVILEARIIMKGDSTSYPLWC